MNRPGVWLGAFLSFALTAGLAQAQPNCGCYYPPIPQAPDMCGPGYYWTSTCGLTYGPSYCLRPPYGPFQGMVPGPPPPRFGPGGPAGPGGACGPGGPGGPGGPVGSPTFPTHPYARSPRDFFMYYDKDEPSYTPSTYGPIAAPAIAPTPYFPQSITPLVPPGPAPMVPPGAPPMVPPG
jgi:hypothetical protein